MKGFLKRIRGWIDKAILNTHDHYLSHLPADIGAFSTFFLKRLFAGIKINNEQSIVSKISKEHIVIYVTKYKSYFEYFLYYSRFKQEGRSYPEIGFGYKPFLLQPASRIFRAFLAHIDYFCRHFTLPSPYESGYFRQELINGRSGLFSLIYRRGLFEKYFMPNPDPVRYLVELQQTTDRPILIVPLLIFFSTNPVRSDPTLIDMLFGTAERPGKRRRIFTLFNRPQKIFSEISEPIELKQFLERPEIRNQSIMHKTLAVRRRLLSQINRHRQSITGPVIKTWDELKENIRTDKQLQNYIELHSKKRNIPVQKLRSDTDAYFEEIAAKYNRTLLKIGELLVRRLLNILFDGISIDDRELIRLKTMSHKGPLILIPCHKSHIDYLIISYIFSINNIPCPLIVAGKNLSFWPFGVIFRAAGAFFIRRTFSGAVLYSKVLAAYVERILTEGFNIELFFEGTRSRSGKLISPQLGFLSMLLNAYKNKACDNMIFVPIHIGYDRVIEESSYLHEVEGGQKEPESLFQVIRARKLLKNRYGKIYLKFHSPILLKSYLEKQGADLSEMTSKQQNTLCRDLGNRIADAINKVAVVTPNALVASAILNSKVKFSYDQLMENVETYLTFIKYQGARMTDTLANPVHAVENILDTYIRRKFIRSSSDNTEKGFSDAVFWVNESKRPNLEYYKNNCIIFFVPAAYTALAILKRDSFNFSAADLHPGYTFISELFQNEFTYDTDKTTEYFVRKNIKAFIDDSIITPHPTMPDTYNITSSGLRKLKLFSCILKTYFESYWVVLNFFMQYPKKSVAAKDRLNKIQAIGERMYKRKEIERKEALSKVNYKNAEMFFIQKGVRGSENEVKTGFYSNAIQKHLKYLS